MLPQLDALFDGPVHEGLERLFLSQIGMLIVKAIGKRAERAIGTFARLFGRLVGSFVAQDVFHVRICSFSCSVVALHYTDPLPA